VGGKFEAAYTAVVVPVAKATARASFMVAESCWVERPC
jgi:hypothetical protein